MPCVSATECLAVMCAGMYLALALALALAFFVFGRGEVWDGIGGRGTFRSTRYPTELSGIKREAGGIVSFAVAAPW